MMWAVNDQGLLIAAYHIYNSWEPHVFSILTLTFVWLIPNIYANSLVLLKTVNIWWHGYLYDDIDTYVMTWVPLWWLGYLYDDMDTCMMYDDVDTYMMTWLSICTAVLIAVHSSDDKSSSNSEGIISW